VSHWAELDENNFVLRVVVGDNDDPKGDEGYKTITDLLGGRWVQTSYNGNFRKNYAGIGYSYDPQRDAFIPIQPFPDWVLNEQSCRWEAPTLNPTETQSNIE
jgi:hypothetical protein